LQVLLESFVRVYCRLKGIAVARLRSERLLGRSQKVFFPLVVHILMSEIHRSVVGMCEFLSWQNSDKRQDHPRAAREVVEKHAGRIVTTKYTELNRKNFKG
jgi:hypothetical protein